MAVRVHTLDVSDVVALLYADGRRLAGVAARQTADHQTGTGARDRTMPAVDAGAEQAACDSANRSAARTAFARGAAGSLAAYLFIRIGPARGVVRPELIKAFTRAGKREHARAFRQRRAPAEQAQRDQ